ncbi:MAG: hypothetical protein V4671_25570 [Armatimonadota bacterium]
MKISGFWVSVFTLTAMTTGVAAGAVQPPTTPPGSGSEPGRERGPRQGGPGGPGGPGRVSLPIAALDVNKDGEISAEEIANATASLKTLDKNNDGRLAALELRPAPPPVVVPASEIVERLMEFDRNGDGTLSLTELPARMKTLLKQSDSNKDGILTQNELISFTEKQEVVRRQETKRREKQEAERQKSQGTPPPPQGAGGPGRVAPIIAALDTDKDGDVSPEELAAAPASLKTLDQNGDGKLTPEELRPAPSPESGPR